MYTQIVFFGVLLLGCSWILPSIAQVPTVINFQAQVQMDPEPEGPVPVTFSLYTASTGGVNVWEETQQLTIKNNILRAFVGQENGFPDDFFLQYDLLYLQLRVDQTVFEDRYQLVPVPYAVRSLVSDRSLSSNSTDKITCTSTDPDAS